MLHRPGREAEPVLVAPTVSESLFARLVSWRVAAMLWRNTVVSCSVFLVGLAVLYALVDGAGFPEVPAAGIGFLVANSLHYLLGARGYSAVPSAARRAATRCS
jgi:hypothetical protein